ncbi:hypothetical protein LP7551_02217 [Roseibium album]|nr:hypothetical protein LP7551_02217 [Roseibium album]
MFRFLAISALLILLISPANAHPSGHGQLEEDEIRERAIWAASYLVTNDVGKEWGLLPKSWSAIPLWQARILANVDSDYVIAVENLMEKKILYFLISSNGSVMDVNFTGNFPYVYDVNDPENMQNKE